MSDDKIKQFLKNDNSAPEKPSNEWSNILKNIEQKNVPPFKFKILVPSFLVLMLFIFGGVQGMNYLQEKEEREIAEYILDSAKYWNEDEANYITEF